MRGDEPLGYGEATGALGEIGELDDLIDQLGQEHPGATLDDVDVEAVERHARAAAPPTTCAGCASWSASCAGRAG